MTEQEAYYILLLFYCVKRSTNCTEIADHNFSLFCYVFRPAQSSSDGLFAMSLGGNQLSTLTICYTKMRFVSILYEYRTRVHLSCILCSKCTPVEVA